MSTEVQQQPTSAGNGAASCRQPDISLRSNLSPASATSARRMPAISRGCCFWVEEVRRKWRAAPSHSSLVGRRSGRGTVPGVLPGSSSGRHLKLLHKLLCLLGKQAPAAEMATVLTGVINILGG